MKSFLLIHVALAISLAGVCALSYGQGAQDKSYQQLLDENAALQKQIKQLTELTEGKAHPINLGRTSLASVSASSVNGSRTFDNQYYGVRNAFDGGDNWINKINYTYWLASGDLGNWVEVHFDKPVTVKYILVEGGGAFTPTFYFHANGEETLPTTSGRLLLEQPLHGVRRVRLTFGKGGVNTKVNEIRVMGFPPPGAKVEIRQPRMLLDTRSAQLLAVDRFNQWRATLGKCFAPRTEEFPDRYVTIFGRNKDAMNLYRVTVWKETSKIETEVLSELTPKNDAISSEE